VKALADKNINSSDNKEKNSLGPEVKLIKRGTWKSKNGSELWDANLSCRHKIRSARGGGVVCVKCGGWCCF
jgi:hypothetical protein